MADERETPRRKVLDRWIASRSWGVSASLMPLVANSAAYAQAPVVAIVADAFLNALAERLLRAWLNPAVGASHASKSFFAGILPPRSKGIAPHSWPVSSDTAVPGAPIPKNPI